MEKILKKFKGKNIRLYTVSGVESYLGVLQGVDKECITLKDAMHGELMYIATQYVESFQEARIGKG
jgi:small nuclear ribonucleoprotein (snRNP)-like protein